MTFYDKLRQLKAFARQDGAFLSLVWIASFACVVYAPGMFLGNLFAIATPFFVGWRLIAFRNYALDGVISFRRGYAYCVYTFFYASAIFAVAQFLYFYFMDNGRFISLFSETVEAMIPVYEASGMDTAQLNESLQLAQSVTPAEWPMLFLTQNIFIGFIAGLPIAAVCMRRKSRNENNYLNNQH